MLTSEAQRHKPIELIDEAHAADAGLVRPCGEIGICLRTLNCKRNAFVCDGDRVDHRK